MKKELMNKEVLAMYDVRGIQNYIFRNNDLQEVIGASQLVENIIVDGIKAVIAEKPKWDQDDLLADEDKKQILKEWEPEKFLTNWEQDNYCAFLNKPDILMQVMFIGGGNAYVLFRKGAICREINRRLAKYVLQNTYSLNLAVAVVEKTDSYKVDYEKINEEMRNIKARMPETKPVGAMPFMSVDTVMGYPLTTLMKYGEGEQRYLCTESYLKISKYKEEAKKEEVRKEEVRKEEARKEEARKEEARKEEDRKEEARKEEARKEEAGKEEAEKEEAGKEEEKKESNKEEGEREELRKENSGEKILDNMVTKKGDSSTLAMIHIDGNNMGKRIKKIMEQKEKYPEAIETMRCISKNIKEGFTYAFDAVTEYIQSVSNQIKKDREGELYRKIILAGDDITFICNAQAAIGAVETFLREIQTKYLYYNQEYSEEENKLNYSFSACAGIAYFYSHFPFSDAYQVAEACCDHAKARAKQKERRNNGKEDGNVGSFFDYQICTHIKAANLNEYREKNYKELEAGKEMIARPYYVACEALDHLKTIDLNQRNKEYRFDILDNNIKFFQSDSIARNQAKKLRNCYALGIEEVKKYIEFLKSRKIDLPKEEEMGLSNKAKTGGRCEYFRISNNPYCFWYDALELMDLYVRKEEKNDNKDRIVK